MRLNFNIIWQRLHHFRGNQLLSVIHMGRPIETCLCVTSYSTQKALNDYKVENEGIGKMALAKNLASLMEESSSHFIQKGASDHNDDKEIGKMALAKNLAFLVQESQDIKEKKSKQKTRVELKRLLEQHIKKKVKEQCVNGKFQNLMSNVIADPKTLMDAYDSIRVTSNVDLALDGDKLPFESMAEELARGEFDVQSNTYGISTKGAKAQKEDLVFPKLKLRIVQEAIRIALEVVYRPHFSKISHGCRNGRGPWSALRYIRKEISDPDYWFTLVINKNLDDCIFTKLVSIMEEKIEDPGLYAIIRSMFDAKVLNWEFGCFPKGHGLPQEGVLSPILMNVYFDPFDREIYRMSMRYEAFDSKHTEDERSHSKLRHWFRRQVNASSVQQSSVRVKPGVRVHCCRFMEEIFFSISGPKEVALSFKSDIEAYLKNSLHLEVDNQTGVLECFGPLGVQFLGTLFKRRLKESPAVRTVHKLKEKIKLFAEQKQESWDAGTVRIGKKWLAHGLKKVKESEIKHLSDNNSLLSEISSFRKAGMETDHWYKHLLKIWMQDVNAKTAASEEVILAKYIAEPALPQELIDSHFAFQQRAKEYISSETTSTLALLSSASSQFIPVSVTEIIAPINIIKKRLHRYGLTNGEGYARTCHLLVLQDDSLIIDWFSGIVRRWLRWYSECDNFNEVKLLISNQIRMSCIRTLAAKYRMHEMLIEKKFDLELSRIPSTQEIELEVENVESASQEFINDDALMYGISYSGLCLVSLARMVSESRPCNCFVVGCLAVAPCVYTLHVMERQKFPGWKTGFSSCIHPSLHRRRIGLCKKHLKDLFLGNISLQSIDFGAWR
ncbi:Intron maturase [Abeliophyllum distichum]|uniref:Intron maturase n=1 Tax=Abeliophyllum distichum TaxID=126358 RepID=A0ABD1NR31_9LAMI